jgi:hypothetical protein
MMRITILMLLITLVAQHGSTIDYRNTFAGKAVITPPKEVRREVEAAYRKGLRYWEMGRLRKAVDEFSTALTLFNVDSGFQIEYYGRWQYVRYYPRVFLVLARCEMATRGQDRVKGKKDRCYCDLPSMATQNAELRIMLRELAEGCASGRYSRTCTLKYIIDSLNCRKECEAFLDEVARWE